MKRDKIIDYLLRGETGFFGDNRDLMGLGPEGNSYTRPLDRAVQHGAADYRQQLEALSDEDLMREAVRADSASIEKESVVEGIRQEAMSENRRAMGRLGGAKAKRAVGIDDACRALNAERPEIGAKAAWNHLLRHPYQSSDGRFVVTGDTAEDRLVQSSGGKVVSISFGTFRREYWPRRAG